MLDDVWHSLGELVEDYNGLFLDQPQHQVDPEVKKMRDALAHGRQLAQFVGTDIVLHRFTKPKAGRVLVESIQALSLAHLNEQIKLLHAQIMRVAGSPLWPVTTVLAS